MLTVCIVYSTGQIVQALFTVYLRADCTLRLLLVKVIQAGERLQQYSINVNYVNFTVHRRSIRHVRESH